MEDSDCVVIPNFAVEKKNQLILFQKELFQTLNDLTTANVAAFPFAISCALGNGFLWAKDQTQFFQCIDQET